MAPFAPSFGSESSASPAESSAMGDLRRAASARKSLWIRPVVAAFAIALGTGTPTLKAQSSADPVPEFLLRDVNPNSPRNTKIVSPRDYRLQISAYYFGAAG